MGVEVGVGDRERDGEESGRSRGAWGGRERTRRSGEFHDPPGNRTHPMPHTS